MMKHDSALIVAIALLMGGNLLAASSDAVIKNLDASVPIFQFMMARQLMGVLMLLPFLLLLPSQKRFTTHLKLHAWRGLSMALGGGCMVYALVNLPLATAASLFYTAPLMVLPMAALWLGERVTGLRALSAALGLLGVVVLLRPTAMDWAAAAGLGCALSIAFGLVTLKKLPSKEPMLVSLIWTAAFSVVPLGLLAAWYWQPLTGDMLWLAFLSNLLIMIYNGCAVLAFRMADASAVSPAEYSGLLFAALIGIFWFDEVPDLFTLAGMVIIVTPLWLLNLDHKRQRIMQLRRKAA